MSLSFEFFKNPVSARSDYDRFVEINSGAVPAFLPRLWSELERYPDPDFLLNQFERLTRSVVSVSSLYQTLATFPPLTARLVKFFAISPFLSEVFFRDFQYAYLLLRPEIDCIPFNPSILSRADNPSYSFTRQLDELKIIKNQELLKIAIRDFILEVPIEETMASISRLADAVLKSVLEKIIHNKFPDVPVPFSIYALGKLGGAELNYSSDIDLMFVYDAEGEFLSNGKNLSHHEFFNRLCSEFVACLNKSTREGQFYRVDTRLRPDGDSGPLARSVNSCLHYYESRGQLWERQMLIKARPIAGDAAFGMKFLSKLDPFVYPKTHFESPMHAIAQMKWRIEEKHQTTIGFNIKTGAGGIRDVEFIVQALQLLNGGQQKDLRCGNTITSLTLLRDAGHLSFSEYTSLSEAYVFFRRIEHLLQIRENQQTHEIPAEASTIASLLKLGSEKMFRDHLQERTSGVRKIFDSVFEIPTELRDDSDLFLSERLTPSLEKKLVEYRYEHPAQAHRLLRSLALGHFPKLYSNLTREHFSRIANNLLDRLALTPSPDQTLLNFERFSAAQPWIDSWYVSLLNPNTLDRVIRIASLATPMTMLLSDRASVFDFLLATNLDDKNEIKNFPEHTVLKKIAWIKYALSLPSRIEHVLLSLSGLADHILHAIFERHFGNAPIALFALGKWGGSELSFKSDLDAIFVCSDTADIDDLIGRAKKMTEEVCAVTSHGKLYELDARLRPEGQQSPLVVTLSRYREYFDGRAMLWERQSLLKARFVSGDAIVKAQFDAFVDGVLFERPFGEAEFGEISKMRARQTKEKSKTSSGFDLKFSGGGLLDIEYLIQAHQIKNRIAEPNTPAAIEKLSHIHPEFRPLKASYLFYRSLEIALFVQLDRRSTSLPTDEKQLDFLSRFCELKSVNDLSNILSEHQNLVRKIFRDFMKDA